MASEKTLEVADSGDNDTSVDDLLSGKDELNVEQAPAPKSQPSAIALPPDGGFEAWLQVTGAFFLFFNPW
jgi:hypothetical protein